MRGTGEAQNHGCHGKTMLFAMLDTAPRRVICPTRRRHRNSELLQFLRTIKANHLAGLVCSTGDAQPENAQGAQGAQGACNQKVGGTPCQASCAFQAGLCLPAAIGCGLGYRVAKDPCVRRKDTSARLDECKNSAWVGAITDLDWARLARHDSVGLGIGTKQRSMRCLLRIRPTVPSWHYCLPRSHRASSWRLPATAQKHQRPIPNATAMPQPLAA